MFINNDILSISSFTNEENKLYFNKLSSGNQNARKTIIEHNLKLVCIFMSNNGYYNRTDREDIFQIGVIGLIKAVDTFKIELGLEFNTYAIKCISNQIFMYFRKCNIILEDTVLDELVKVENEEAKYTKKEFLFSSVDLEDYHVNKMTNHHYYELLLYFLDKLPLKYKIAFSSFYGVNTPKIEQKEIALKLGVTQSAVSRIIEKSTFLIKDFLSYHIDKDEYRLKKTLYDYFNIDDKDILNKKILKINSPLLRKYYNQDNYLKSDIIVNQSEFINFYVEVILPIYQTLNVNKSKINKKNLYTCFSGYSEDEINMALNFISEEEIKILKIRFGDDYQGFCTYDKNNKVFNMYNELKLILLKINRILKKLFVTKTRLDFIIARLLVVDKKYNQDFNYNKEIKLIRYIFNELFSNKNYDIKEMIKYLIDGNFGYKFSLEEISYILNISSEDVIYYDSFNKNTIVML